MPRKRISGVTHSNIRKGTTAWFEAEASKREMTVEEFKELLEKGKDDGRPLQPYRDQ